MASPAPPLPTCHASADAHPKMSGHLALQLRSIAPQSFIAVGQLKGVVKSSGLTRCISRGGQLPALLPSHHGIPNAVRASGTPRLPGSHAPSPLPCQGFFLCTTDGHKLFGKHCHSHPQIPQKDASPEQGAIPSRLRHSTLFRGAGKSLTRPSFSGGGRAAFHSHDKLLLSKLHECSY